MTYQLRPENGLIDSARTILTEQLVSAAHSLENPANGRDAAVHLARRKLKRARGLYRLIAAAAPDFRKQENIRLRDIARSLAGLRDASALVESVTYLQAWTEEEEEQKALTTALSLLKAQSEQTLETNQSCDDCILTAAANCREAAEALAQADITVRTAKSGRILQKAWRKLMIQAQEAIAICQTGSEAESFHDLRKTSQTYWMYLSLLRDLWPSAFLLKRQCAKQLADQLGHENDLSMLAAALDQQAASFDSAETLSHLLGMIIRRQQVLRADALAAAEALFRDGPELEPAIVMGLWLRYADLAQN
ncbi:CHAD domain-containing protein [Rhizobium sp.]|jgi:hypothetical protein|uniref:CHAD domain-containing protein n=1 Tax=Rhizobium sp. TaxID=391 RepID=UPI000E9BFD1C|nr:metal-binding protein [Rhizobium sp.]